MTSRSYSTTTLLSVHPIWPLLIGLGTALWFGIIGHRYRRAAALWAVAGLVVGLSIGEICSGLANAVAVPYSDVVISKYEAIAFAFSVIIIALSGFVLALLANPRAFPGQNDHKPTR